MKKGFNYAFVFISITVALFFSCRKEIITGFTADKEIAAIGEAIKFIDKEEERKNASFEWDFGDGNVSNEKNPSHKYEMAGTYTVTQTVIIHKNEKKGKNFHKSESIEISIEGPAADFKTSKSEYGVREAIILENTTLERENGYITNYEWIVYNSNGLTSVLGNKKDISVAFEDAGEYTITLTAKQGNTESYKSSTITVNGATPPDANAAVKAMITGEWQGGLTSETYSISGSNENQSCPQNNTTNNVNPITKILFYGNGTAWEYRQNGNQTSGNLMNWSISADGKFLTYSGTTSGYLEGIFSIENLSANKFSLKKLISVNTAQCGTIHDLITVELSR